MHSDYSYEIVTHTHTYTRKRWHEFSFIAATGPDNTRLLAICYTHSKVDERALADSPRPGRVRRSDGPVPSPVPQTTSRRIWERARRLRRRTTTPRCARAHHHDIYNNTRVRARVADSSSTACRSSSFHPGGKRARKYGNCLLCVCVCLCTDYGQHQCATLALVQSPREQKRTRAHILNCDFICVTLYLYDYDLIVPSRYPAGSTRLQRWRALGGAHTFRARSRC